MSAQMIDISKKNPVAYFSAEYGLEAKLPIYAGGLGVLSGDHVKAAAEQNYPLVAVGLLYRGVGAVQEIDADGRQTESNWDYDPLGVGLEHVYMNEMPLFIKVHLTTVDVWARVWKKKIGDSVDLYLLDTETDQNLQQERIITHALYNGTEEALMKQQLILGIGGVKLLHDLGIHPAMYHVNEGRPAFLHWQLIRSYMDDNRMSYEDAAKKAREKTVYTNHTLVAAGNQSYNIHMLRSYSHYYAEKMGISIDNLLEPGVEDNAEHFVMTRFALNTSHKTNGVSKLHSKLCAEHWPEYNWCNITNGVNMKTWQDEEIRNCDKSGNDLWHMHLKKKRETMEYVQELTGYGYDPDHLIITWARRIATYKRFNDIFADAVKLSNILKNEKRPVHILMAGKAHARDTQAKMLLQEVIHHMGHEFAGHVIFVPNYNIDIGKKLVSGSDVWLNTPIFGKEASGTSGMKAIANGVLQCTVKDGWTYEVEWHDMGWVLDPEHMQVSFYNLLEHEIAPMYYHRNDQNVSEEWLNRMKKSIELSNGFSAKRMLDQYRERMYK